MITLTLGLDPGLACLGHAVLLGPDPLPAYCGVWEHGPGAGTEDERLALYAESLACLLDDLQAEYGAHPSLACLEAQFVSPDPARRKAVLQVAAARGCCLGVLGSRGVSAITVRPQDAKLALAGTGGATKAQMLEAARRRWGLELQAKDEHLADAIGIALAGAARHRTRGWGK